MTGSSGRCGKRKHFRRLLNARFPACAMASLEHRAEKACPGLDPEGEPAFDKAMLNQQCRA